MTGHALLAVVEQIAGAVLLLVILSDVFMTVLYARIGTGLLSDHVSSGTWRLFKAVSNLLGQRKETFLSFCGPTVMVLILFVWSFGLVIANALILHPHLGHSILSANGPTPEDFATAVYTATGSISLLGANEFRPVTAPFRLFFVVDAVVGLSTISLTITYLMQVYTALRQRTTLGVKLHVLSNGTGDAAELVARLGPNGRFEIGYTLIAELAAEVTRLKESHHFYPIVFYFRFREPFYSVSNAAQLALEAVALIKTALNDDEYSWLKQSAAVSELGSSAKSLVELLDQAFLPGTAPGADQFSGDDLKSWRARFAQAIAVTRAAGIKTTRNEQAAGQRYVELRREWEPFVARLARAGHVSRGQITSGFGN